jgi:D-glycerate 3-kinase
VTATSPSVPGRVATDLIATAVDSWSRGSVGPLVVGLCGSPGAGKSTIAAAISARGGTVATLSLDDLYLGARARGWLATDVHPLLTTRGPPGTHDVALGLAVLAKLVGGEPVAVPRFDKATDEPAPRSEWPVVERPDVVLFEGWCVGAVAQPSETLVHQINDLERTRDPDGTWRRFVNDQLAGPYRALFSPIDRLIVLLPPDFATVVGWRQDAERRRPRGPATMADDGIVGFLAHYERLCRWIDAEMPSRADLVIRLAADRSVAE